jgi:hypothetical protein
MYPVISETYIGEDIDSLAAAGARVTISAVQAAAIAGGRRSDVLARPGRGHHRGGA